MKTINIDFTGLSLDEAILKAARSVDRVYEFAMGRTQRILIEHGATAEELERTLRWQHDAFLEYRSEAVAVVREFYAEGPESIH